MTNEHFIQELARLKSPVWRKIKNYLPIQEPIGHYEMIREYPLRQGKYFRPGLVILATEMFGGKAKDAYLVAAAMQLSEDWLLIHDDIEDHSDQRRHKPTLHTMYNNELAINAGDALHMIMWRVLGDAVRLFDTKKGTEIFTLMNNILLTATEGQYLELSWIHQKKTAITEDEYLDMVRRKTAEYTVIGPLMLGAMIAGKTAKEIRGIKAWGLPFGYAFQIWDDYMNVTVSTKKQGKEYGGDILEGKRTLILSHLLSHCNHQEKKKIESIYHKAREQKTKSDVDYILKQMTIHGSMDYAKEAALRFRNEAEKLFDAKTAHLTNTRAKRTIRAGIGFVVDRTC